MKYFSALVLFFFLQKLPAQPLQLTWDIGFSADSLPVSKSLDYGIARLGNQLLFVNSDEVHGEELWATDGSAVGTRLVLDIFPGTVTGHPHGFKEFGGAVFFLANSPNFGTEIWKTDGTTAGTFLLKDILPGAAGAMENTNFKGFVEFQGRLFFAADDGIAGTELWASDGTAAGTKLVADLAPDAGESAFPNDFLVLNNQLIFSAFSPDSGIEIWRSDGTSAGTFLLKDLEPGYENGFDKMLGASAGFAFFQQKTYVPSSIWTSKIWRTDGTPDGTFLLQEFPELHEIAFAGGLGGSAFFVAPQNANELALWISDGTKTGTVPLKTLPNISGGLESKTLFEKNGQLYFLVRGWNDSWWSCWRTDGTAAGTVQLSNQVENSEIFVDEGDMIFRIETQKISSFDDPPNLPAVSFIFPKLWLDNPSGKHFRQVGQQVFANFQNLDPKQKDFFGKINLTNGVVEPFFTFLKTEQISSFPQPIGNLNDQVFFTAIDPKSDRRSLFSMDSNSGERLHFDSLLESFPVLIRSVGHFSGGKFYFLRNREDHPIYWSELWATDGSLGNLQKMADLPFQYGLNFFEIAGKVIFNVNNSQFPNQNGLWETDGTAAGTKIFRPGNFRNPVRVGNWIYFLETIPTGNNQSSYEIWRTDGQAVEFFKNAGQSSVGGPPSYPFFYQIIDPAAVDGRYAEFTAASFGGWTYNELWVDAFGKLPKNGSTTFITGGHCFSFAYRDTFGSDAHSVLIWRTDTAGNSIKLGEILPNGGADYPCFLWATGVNGKIVLATGQNQNDCQAQIWLSDGQSAPQLFGLKTSNSWTNADFVRTDSMVVFPAHDGTGWAFWRSNGSPDSTFKIANFPTTASADHFPFSNFYVNGALLYFSADDGKHGEELWTLDLRSEKLVKLVEPTIFENEKWRIFPNPTSGEFSVFENENEVGLLEKVEVLDFSGRKLRSFWIARGEKPSVAGLPAGVYFVKCFLKNGQLRGLRLVKN